MAFTTSASLVDGQPTGGWSNVWVRDTQAATTIRVSTSIGPVGGFANNNSLHPIIADNARYVAFASSASNLVAGDTGQQDIFVRDLASGAITRVTLGANDVQPNGASGLPSISADGRYVAYSTVATNLVANDTDSGNDVLLADRLGFPMVPVTQTFGNGGPGGVGQGEFGVNPTGYQAEPVNTATGAYATSVTDLALPGIGLPFGFTRSYTSADPTSGPLGPGWTHNYLASLAAEQYGAVVVRGPDGQQLAFTRNDDGSFTPPPGGRATLATVTGGHELTTYDQRRWRFNSDGRLTSIKDRNDQGLSLAYNGEGRLATITDSANRTIQLTYTGGLLTQVELPDGRDVSYGYTSGRLTTVTDVRGHTTSYAYDSNGRLADITDQNNHQLIHNVYGSDGRISSQTTPMGNASFAWNADTQTATYTDPRGKRWKDLYKANRLVARIDPLNHTTSYSYDTDFNVTSITSPRGHTTTMTYDTRGNMLTVTGPAPSSVSQEFTYNSRNDLVTAENGRGHTTSYGYDAAGNLTSITRPGDTKTTFGRDPAGTGMLTSITDPRGNTAGATRADHTTSFAYDSAGNLTEITNPLGHTTTMTYDSAGRMTSVVEPRGNAAGADPDDYRTSFTYNQANQQLTSHSPLGHDTTWAYDNAGNLTSVTDANTHTTGYAYDNANNLIRVTAPGGAQTNYDYDAAGNLTGRTDANNHTTTYSYDDAGRLVTTTAPQSRTWSYSYDDNSNLTKIIDANGAATSGDPDDGTTTYSYDELDRLTALNYSDTTPDVSFGYDANSNRTQVTDGAGTQTATYDALDRLTDLARGGSSFTYAYADKVNMTSRTYPDGTTVSLAYDNHNQLASVASGGATTSYDYDPAGRLKTTALPATNGHTETRSYDRDGRLSQVKHAKSVVTLAQFDYTLDPVGNPTEIATPTATHTATYDSRDRLTEYCFSTACGDYRRYTYDPVGNRLTEATPAGTTSYSYDAADRLTQTTLGATTTTYGFDANGNQTAAGANSFTYDQANRLKTATVGGATINYSYDGDGTRLQATSGGAPSQTTKYTWDHNASQPQLVAEHDGADSPLRRYLYGADRVSVTSNLAGIPLTSYYHHDGLGSVVNLTDTLGISQRSYTYEPYGGVYSSTALPGAPANPMQFTGELHQADTGLIHLRAREYDPTTGRFLQTDPLGPGIAAPYQSPYAYADNLPTRLTDPSGLAPWYEQGWATWSGWQAIGDLGAGIADNSTFGATEWVRKQLGVNEQVNKCSTIYTGGTLLSIIMPLPSGKAGAVGKAVRMQSAVRSGKSADGFVDLTTAARRKHILYGDGRGGGHLWPGRPGKTPFPKDWSAERILNAISDVATDPRAVRVPGRGGSTIVRGSRDGVDIEVIIRNDEIITGYPTNLPRNP